MSTVVIGMDPHKRSATIEVMAGDEAVVGGGRYATDTAGYRSMLAEAKRWPERIWAIEGCQGIGRHIASRLLADGEDVVDVPPKLAARTRVFATGQGRKTDATDAHSVALAATRMTGLRPVVADQQLMVLRPRATRLRTGSPGLTSRDRPGPARCGGWIRHPIRGRLRRPLRPSEPDRLPSAAR
jgi:hypothetical protein